MSSRHGPDRRATGELAVVIGARARGDFREDARNLIFSIPQIIEYLSSVVTTGMDVVEEMGREAVAVDPWGWRA